MKSFEVSAMNGSSFRQAQKRYGVRSLSHGMAEQVSIPVSPNTRNRVREIKGFERTYDELLSEWASEFGNDGRAKSGT